MVEDSIKDKATSTESATDVSTSSSSGISSSVPISTVEVNTTKLGVKYPIEELIKNTKALTGHKREVAVGALFDCKEKELTKDDFKKLIDAFLKRKVK